MESLSKRPYREHGSNGLLYTTVLFRQFYGFFIISHARRKIIHFSITFHPTAEWVVRQLRNAFPYDTAPKYLIFDRDSIFGGLVLKTVRTSYRSPRQNGIAERWVGSCRRELLDHVIVFGELHLHRLCKDYVSYNEDRCQELAGCIIVMNGNLSLLPTST